MKNKIRLYTDEEIQKLLKNPNIIEIKNKSRLVYKNEFKYWAVLQKKFYPDKSANAIFKEAGFDTNILSDRLPDKRLLEWTRKYNRYGKDYFNPYKSHYKSIKQNDNDLSMQEIVIHIK
mgnify:CR=1 FL=1